MSPFVQRAVEAKYYCCGYIRFRVMLAAIGGLVAKSSGKAGTPLTASVFAILLALAGGEKHGYAIMKDVSAPDGGGLAMGPGTLYGSLDRMIASGLVEETGLSDDERRRYYRITRLGRKMLNAEVARLSRTLSAAQRRGIQTVGGDA